MAPPGLRSLSPSLHRFLIATVINMVGSAALFGFVLIYFHEVRGISLAQAGLAVGSMSFAMVVCTPGCGALSDRWGARFVLALGCIVSIVAGALYAFATDFTSAVAVSALLGVGNALRFPAQSALISLIATPAERPTVSAFQRAALNLGAALGGVVGGFLVASESLRAFQWLFAVNVLSNVVFLAVLPGMPSGRVERDAGGERPPGFSVVLRDGFYMRLLLTDISIALGFGFLWSFTPAYASEIGIGNATIGLLFTFGAVAVVVTQIPTVRWVSGRRRMHSLAVMNLWFVGAFLVMVATPHIALGAAIVAIALAQVLGGFGEAVLGAVRQPLAADLAPPELMGRYMGLSVMVFQGCMGLSNTIGGLVMDRSLTLVWFIPLVASAVGVLGSWSLRHRIPSHVAISP